MKLKGRGKDAMQKKKKKQGGSRREKEGRKIETWRQPSQREQQ